MRLIKVFPKDHPIDGTIYEEVEVRVSEDIEVLKAMGKRLAREMGHSSTEWLYLRPVMGDKKLKGVEEFEMRLPDGVLLQIRR